MIPNQPSKLLLIFLTFFVPLAFASCAASGTPFADRPAPPGKTRIYIYREGSMLGAANNWHLYANNHEITKITNGGYYDYVTDPGHIEFSQFLEMRAVDILGAAIVRGAGAQPLAIIQAQPDTVYYFQFELGPKMNQVGKDRALKAMAGMHRFADAPPTAKP